MFLNQLARSRQFDSKHSLEEGGTEKYYFALVHGQVPCAMCAASLAVHSTCSKVQIPAQAIIQGTGEVPV